MILTASLKILALIAGLTIAAGAGAEPFNIHCYEVGNTTQERLAFSFYQYDENWVVTELFKGGRKTFTVRTNLFIDKEGKRGTRYTFNLGVQGSYVEVRFKKNSLGALGKYVPAKPEKPRTLHCSRKKMLISIHGSARENKAEVAKEALAETSKCSSALDANSSSAMELE